MSSSALRKATLSSPLVAALVTNGRDGLRAVSARTRPCAVRPGLNRSRKPPGHAIDRTHVDMARGQVLQALNVATSDDDVREEALAIGDTCEREARQVHAGVGAQAVAAEDAAAQIVELRRPLAGADDEESAMVWAFAAGHRIARCRQHAALTAKIPKERVSAGLRKNHVGIDTIRAGVRIVVQWAVADTQPLCDGQLPQHAPERRIGVRHLREVVHRQAGRESHGLASNAGACASS